jgi:hypothetical protein
LPAQAANLQPALAVFDVAPSFCSPDKTDPFYLPPDYACLHFPLAHGERASHPQSLSDEALTGQDYSSLDYLTSAIDAPERVSLIPGASPC